MTDVTEERGLGFINVCELLVHFSKFLVGGIQFLTSAQGFSFHCVTVPLESFRALSFKLVCAAQANELGNVLDAMDDVPDLTFCGEHGRVQGAPEPFFKSSPLALRPADVVFLHCHCIRRFVCNDPFREARKLLVPVAWGSSGLSGNTSKRPRPMTSCRWVRVACRYASLAPTILNSASGCRTRNKPGALSKRSLKSRLEDLLFIMPNSRVDGMPGTR